ncbi:DegV family protein [Pseudoflavonifractor sp. AF19-9AC]|uniref:DegV family protein n=1 Tax=Pseudoflavonifractor sp. AF19-9AC TaxID=2292244 RepID=UPI000E48449F|nr:DegV family protein [Pseudoflavonifractor sp. AF19-9AC]RHR09033.1 DegV family protein [Pseudoflavonifractor sp. AF19-9AC]
MSFKIVVDSCCDLTPQMLKDPCFVKAPLTIQSNGSTFVDDENFDQADLLWSMKQSEQAPSTACPSPQVYLDAYCEGDPDDVYVVTLSALLSGSHNSAEQAKLMLEEDRPQVNVHVFNSCSAASGEVLVALKIRELAESGMPFKHVVREVEQFIYQMQTLFVLESLENLRKNGRLTKLQAVVTGALRIKLMMSATPEGEICKLGQAMSMKQALTKLVDRMAADPNHEGRTLAICHCNCLERAFLVKAMAEQKCKFAHILLLEAGGITTVYANDGGVVLAYG